MLFCHAVACPYVCDVFVIAVIYLPGLSYCHVFVSVPCVIVSLRSYAISCYDVYVSIYIYIYIERDKESERKREREREREKEIHFFHIFGSDAVSRAGKQNLQGWTSTELQEL